MMLDFFPTTCIINANTGCSAAAMIPDLAAIRKVFDGLRDDPMMAARVRNDPAIPADDAIMSENAAKAHRDNITRPEVTLIVHR